MRGIGAYRLRMVPGPTLVDALLRELESGVVVPDPYSRRSVYGRCEPMMLTAVLALVAIVAGMLLGKTAEPDDEA